MEFKTVDDIIPFALLLMFAAQIVVLVTLIGS